MKDDKIKIVPAVFKKMADYKVADTRFVPVEIVLMHLGENYNGSYFSKKIVQEAIPSLANTPILAYMEKNSDNEDDFSDHRSVVVKQSNDEGYEIEYVGAAIGVIPENNNARFEDRDDGNGNIKTYLIVDGLIWTKWKKPLRIFDERNGKVLQSMELHQDYEGEMKDDGLFHFTKFSFFGACALGKDVSPAMEGANISVNFAMEDFIVELQTKMEEYKLFQLNKDKKGGDSMNEREKKLVLLKSFSKSLEEIKELGIDFESITYEDLDSQLKEIAEDKKDDSNDDSKDNVEPKQDDKKDDSDFADGADDVKDSDVSDDSADDVKDDIKDGDDSDSKDELSDDNKDDDKDTDYQKLYEELKSEFEALQADYAVIEQTNAKLKEFKESRLSEDRKSEEKELFGKYEMLEGIEDFESLKKKSSEFEKIDDLEKEIALIFTRNYAKLNFNKKQEKETKNSFNLDNDKDKQSKYGDLFEKFGK